MIGSLQSILLGAKLYKVLVSCPPMLKMIDRFKDDFKKYEIDFDVVETVQTLTEDEIKKILPKYDGWILGDDPANEEVLRVGKTGKLKAIVKWGVGTDNVNFDAAQNLNIKATNTPGMFGDEVSDVAIAYLLGLARHTYYIDRNVRQGEWPKPAGSSLKNKCLGIVGLGDIGKNIAKKASVFGLSLIGWDPFIEPKLKELHQEKNWPNGLEKCDFIIFSCSLNDRTKYMFNNSLKNKIKKKISVINVSRGQLIDEKFLEELINENLLQGLAMDVFETEPPNISDRIFSFENSIFGSHNASNTIEAVEKTSVVAIKYIGEMLNE